MQLTMGQASRTDGMPTRVLSAFGVEGLRVLRPVEVGNRNESFGVEGAGGRKYVLRRFRRNTDPDRLRFQLTFQEFAFGRGLPVPEVVKTASSEVLLQDASGMWALFTFVDGTNLASTLCVL